MTVAISVSSEKGVKDLDAYLSERSYIQGYQPTNADVAVFEAFSKAPTSSTPHALRWYNHIKSFTADEKKKFTGDKKIPTTLGAGAASAPATAKPAAKADDDDDVDLFGSDDEEDAEAAKLREERLKAYSEKKSKKPALIAKSSIVLDVKPWDDETDMKEMEAKVRTIVKEGLVWGASKLVPVGYGIKKLQIMCVVEDDKVSVDELTEDITNFEDFVQSVDIAAFNKI
ncbi:elongation factor 1-beta'-like [Macrosteles quadrilineatus]|uniref:elongation factor 1-beta'-like n=1 Tax=Macrosteles quadrilineatus TaxID=74068 RepID=UPI0023E20D14|nr:elongation factor 1-beta'-like [Macrosteles quadrilineatus]